MTDALGANSSIYIYDARGRLSQEIRIIDSNNYITQYTYDGADRVTTITYPTGEVVTQGYNGRGLPDTLASDDANVGDLVTSTLYNALGNMMELNLGNSTKTTYGYYGTGGTYDTIGGYYGRLWEIKTTKQPGGTPVLQDIQHSWDAGGNLIQRQDMVATETENFNYDSLDRLLNAYSGSYNEIYTYDQIGNITSKVDSNDNLLNYTYGTQPHAVTLVGSTSYAYDANGNMTTRGNQTLTWDTENRPVCITDGTNTSTFVYDGDGNRVKKTEGGQTTIYINKYYEKNVTTGQITTNYYLGSKLIAIKKGDDLSYIQQDSLSSTSVISDSSGNSVGTIRYFPFGAIRSTSGTLPTDKAFTGQRLDSTGLYYYGARYYDPEIGRFISADTMVPNPMNPQSFNRYSYCLNNPLKYIDPSGHYYVEPVAGGYWLHDGDVQTFCQDQAHLIMVEHLHGIADSGGGIIAGIKNAISTLVSWVMPNYDIWHHCDKGYEGESALPIDQSNKDDPSLQFGGIGGVTSGGQPYSGKDVTIDQHVIKRMGDRGWTEQEIRDTIDKPYATRPAIDKYNGNPATAYYRSSGSGDYVVVDNVKENAFAVGKANDVDWVPDNTIQNPFLPRTMPRAMIDDFAAPIDPLDYYFDPMP